MALEVDHLSLDQLGLQHGNGSLLEGVTGSTIEIATARTDTRGIVSTVIRIQARIAMSTYALMYSVFSPS